MSYSWYSKQMIVTLEGGGQTDLYICDCQTQRNNTLRCIREQRDLRNRRVAESFLYHPIACGAAMENKNNRARFSRRIAGRHFRTIYERNIPPRRLPFRVRHSAGKI